MTDQIAGRETPACCRTLTSSTSKHAGAVLKQGLLRHGLTQWAHTVEAQWKHGLTQWAHTVGSHSGLTQWKHGLTQWKQQFISPLPLISGGAAQLFELRSPMPT